ncbi:MAG: Transposase IS200 like protein [Pelotomaculum sp. PtaB.Bin104]|nr:MAG: Transposase IS200 like protein [Pelotomaculum sp. PtaB.Bin104]
MIIGGSVSKDHVHLLISCPPSLAPAKIIQHLKGALAQKVLWSTPLGKKYFCAIVGAITEELVKEYVENQQTDGSEEAFKIDD